MFLIVIRYLGQINRHSCVKGRSRVLAPVIFQFCISHYGELIELFGLLDAYMADSLNCQLFSLARLELQPAGRPFVSGNLTMGSTKLLSRVNAIERGKRSPALQSLKVNFLENGSSLFL
jgi:hypothetical protein